MENRRISCRVLAGTCLLAGASLPARAAMSTDAALSTVLSELKKVANSGLTIAMVLIGIIMVIGAATLLPKYLSGDHEAKHAIVHWGTGLLFALIAIAVSKAVFF